MGAGASLGWCFNLIPSGEGVRLGGGLFLSLFFTLSFFFGEALLIDQRVQQ